ncbi:MAG: flagellar biosynthesis anti-sigma factor FlgM [Denitrovibrio sp.]|nr:MAG: flagellar biosynthesis anti-sigma factor FlgM [Denitrovibrio sp.]
MRIDDKLNLNLNKLKETEDRKKADKSDSSKESAKSGDSVSLSSSATDVSNVKDAIKSSPDIRVELVSELKVKIENGQYNVSGREVAEKIVQTAIDDLF